MQTEVERIRLTYEDYAEWRKGWRDRMGFGPESRAGRYRKLLRK